MFPLRDSVTYHGPALVTKVLIGLNVWIFFLQLGGGPPGFIRAIEAYGFVPAIFFSDPAAQAYRLLSSMFMHGSVAHLIGNMWFLWVFGPAIEARLGEVRYLLLYLLAGLGGALSQGVTDPGSTIPLVGASGAISGVLGGYMLLLPNAWILSMAWFILPVYFWVPAVTYIGYWVLFQFVYGLFGVPGVGWWAHLGGFFVGLALAALWRPKTPYGAEPFWQREHGAGEGLERP